MVYVEPAGGAPNMFTRGFKYLFFAQQATAPHQADVFVDYIKSLPGRPAAEDRGVPDAGRPVRRPGDRGHQGEARGGRGRRPSTARSTRPDTTNFQSIASRGRAKKPDLIAQGAVLRGRRRPGPLAQAARLLAEDAVPDLGAEQRRPVQQRDRRRPTPRASSTRSAGTQDAKTPAERGLRRGLPGAKYKRRPGRGRRRRVRGGAGAAGGGRPTVGDDRPGQAPGLAARQRGADDPRPALAGTPPASRSGQFLLAQWQTGKSRGGAPEETATTTTVVNPKPDWQVATDGTSGGQRPLPAPSSPASRHDAARPGARPRRPDRRRLRADGLRADADLRGHATSSTSPRVRSSSWSRR